MIGEYNRGITIRMDRAVADAKFLHEHPGWKPEDLGYPPGDYIMVDLMRLFA